MLILKKVVTNKRSKNVEILNLSSQICLKLSGKTISFVRRRILNVSSQAFDSPAAKVEKTFLGCPQLWKTSTSCLENLTWQRTNTRQLWRPSEGRLNKINSKKTTSFMILTFSEGTRRANCMKNADNDKYAFKTLQLATFPRQYRPPVGTFGSIKNHW